MDAKKEKLANLILEILNAAGEVAKVKLAKLVLFSEIEHFRSHGESITGLYFVRLRMGPVVAFFDEVLESGEGRLWAREDKPIDILGVEKPKVQYSYTPLQRAAVDSLVGKTVKKVARKYGKMTGTRLAALSHQLPAWRHSEPDEPIYTAELAIADEEKYFELTDILENIEEGDERIVAKKISQALR